VKNASRIKIYGGNAGVGGGVLGKGGSGIVRGSRVKRCRLRRVGDHFYPGIAPGTVKDPQEATEEILIYKAMTLEKGGRAIQGILSSHIS